MKKTVIASTSNKQALRRVRAKAGVKAPYHVLCDASFLRCAFDYFCQVERFQLQQKQKKKVKDEAAGDSSSAGAKKGGGAGAAIGWSKTPGYGGGASSSFGRGGRGGSRGGARGGYHGSQWGGHAAEPTPEDNMYPPLRDLVNSALGGGPTFLHIIEESKQAFIQSTLEPTGKVSEKVKKPAKENKNGPLKEKPKYVMVQKFLGQLFENVPSLPPRGFQEEQKQQQSAAAVLAAATAEAVAAEAPKQVHKQMHKNAGGKKKKEDETAKAIDTSAAFARNEHKAVADRVLGSLLLSKGGSDALHLSSDKANAAIVEGMYIVGTNSHDTRRELQARCGSLFAVPTLRFTFNPTLLWLEEGEETKVATPRGGPALQTHGTYLDKLRRCFEGASAAPLAPGSPGTGRSLIATPIATSVSAAKLKHVTSIADRAFLRSLESGEYFEKNSAEKKKEVGTKRARSEEKGDDDGDEKKDEDDATTTKSTRPPKRPVKNIYNEKLMKHLQSKGIRVRASAFTRAIGGGFVSATVTPPTSVTSRKSSAAEKGGKKKGADGSNATAPAVHKGPKEHGANPLSVKKKKQRETFDFTKSA